MNQSRKSGEWFKPIKTIIGKYLSVSLLLIILMCFAFIFQKQTIKKMPCNTHSWAQSDRWGLSMGFLRNGLNFFEPETYIYNKEFPENFTRVWSTTKTAVEFPIHDYIPAVIMKITGHVSPFWFRFYVLLYSLVGLYFLYKIALFWTNNRWWAIFVTLFAALSPVFVFYQGNFLPTIPSMANVIIGLYFYLRFIDKERLRWLLWALFFLALAGLSRMPFSIYLIAILGVELLKSIEYKKFRWINILILFTGLLFILTYFIYNRYLYKENGSMFLSSPLPPKSFEDIIYIIQISWSNWGFQYFTKIQYFLLGIILIYAIFIKRPTINFFKSSFVRIVLLAGLGILVYSCLMVQQFVYHDYYFLDTFYLPVILVLLLVGKVFSRLNKLNYGLLIITLFVGLIYGGRVTFKEQNKRLSLAWYEKTLYISQAFQGSDSLFMHSGFDKSAKVLVLSAQAPNLPFSLIDRKGYAVMDDSKESIQKALQWDYDVIAVANAFLFTPILKDYPFLMQQTEFLGTNGKLSLLKKLNKERDSIQLEEYIKIDSLIPILDSRKNSECGQWYNLKETSNPDNSGDSVEYISSSDEFGITYKYFSNGTIHPFIGMISVTGDFYSKEVLEDVLLVFTVNIHGETQYYGNYQLADIVDKPNQWMTEIVKFYSGQTLEAGSELCVFIWNKGHKTFYYRNLEIKVY
jgi:hypothetical protein